MDIWPGSSQEAILFSILAKVVYCISFQYCFLQNYNGLGSDWFDSDDLMQLLSWIEFMKWQATWLSLHICNTLFSIVSCIIIKNWLAIGSKLMTWCSDPWIDSLLIFSLFTPNLVLVPFFCRNSHDNYGISNYFRFKLGSK